MHKLFKMNLKTKWLITGGLAMFLLGFGISIIGDAIMQRTLHAEFSVWFFEGLLGLIVFNAGVGIFGKAVILRIELNNS